MPQPTPPPTPALPPPDALAPVAAPPAALVLSGGWQIEGLPAMVLRAGPQAAERTVEFFTAQIRNPHTRAAYGTAVTRFFTSTPCAPGSSKPTRRAPPRSKRPAAEAWDALATHAAKQLAECRHGAELAERTRRRWAH